MLMSGQKNSIKLANRSFEDEAKFKCLENNRKNACMKRIRADYIQAIFATFRSRVFLSSRLLSRNVKVKTYTAILLPVALYGRKTWSLTLREEHRLRVFENRVL
jgi:hypothetical protein